MSKRSSQAVLAGTVALLSASALADAPPPCNASEAEYTLAANLQLSDTPMGAGDGVYPIGPGKTVLRFEGSNVKMLSYTMRVSFTVRTTVAFWTTTVKMDAQSTATPNACSVAAEGILEGRTVHWRTPVSGYRTDGTLTCTGTFCGQFGAPPRGQTPLHIGPAPAKFGDFVFSPDFKTFTMAKTAGQKTEMPKQTSTVSNSGREVRRTCVGTQPCKT